MAALTNLDTIQIPANGVDANPAWGVAVNNNFKIDIAKDQYGLLASRPAAGNEGYRYVATDVLNSAGVMGLEYWDNGTAWVPVNPSPYIIGEVKEVAIPSITALNPTWLLCDGSAVSRTTYAALYAAIGVTYGPGNGTTTFNVPDKRGRTGIGAGTGSGLTTRALGAAGGEENHVLATAELAAHNHAITDPHHSHGNTSNESGPHTHNFPGSYVLVSGSSSVGLQAGGSNPAYGNAELTTSGESANHVHAVAAAATGITGTQNTGAGTGHNTMQPFVAFNYIIKT